MTSISATGGVHKTLPQPTATNAAKGLQRAESATASTVALTGAASSPGPDTVEVSGHSILLSRLFPGQDAATATQVRPPGSNPDGVSIASFLTTSDRSAISSLYEYARDHGIDAADIDNIAFDLGGYRRTAPGVLQDTVGQMFDEDGEPITYAFSQHDEATAIDILGSRAASDSALPRGFLEHLLDPGLTGGNHATNFDVLQRVVYATSASGADGSRDPHATIAPRPLERLAQMKAAGLIPTPAQMRATAAGAVIGPNGQPVSLFEQYASRLGTAAAALSDADKDLLGPLYAATASQYGPLSTQMKQVDELARTLATVRALGHGDDLGDFLKQLLQDRAPK
ncbi:hypothetical protein OG218_02050 [Kineococcus sp. NBC_00420]|uniref:hypothetical protein n=1 Tax=Kineococcus sp. NBC_00420 TaxID=2903564 RepID=UPI002E22B68B